jgi:hypothetical protein
MAVFNVGGTETPLSVSCRGKQWRLFIFFGSGLKMVHVVVEEKCSETQFGQKNEARGFVYRTMALEIR